MVEAFRDTTLSNVWQLAASLKEKSHPTNSGGSITRLFPIFPNKQSTSKLFPTINTGYCRTLVAPTFPQRNFNHFYLNWEIYLNPIIVG